MSIKEQLKEDAINYMEALYLYRQSLLLSDMVAKSKDKKGRKDFNDGIMNYVENKFTHSVESLVQTLTTIFRKWSVEQNRMIGFSAGGRDYKNMSIMQTKCMLRSIFLDVSNIKPPKPFITEAGIDDKLFDEFLRQANDVLNISITP